MALDNKTVEDVFAWMFNVSTSVLIVFVNKLLMDKNFGYGFVFGECWGHVGDIG